MKEARIDGALAGVVLALVVAAFGGWIANIVKLAGMDFGVITGLLVLRALGVVMPPLGTVLGFV